MTLAELIVTLTELGRHPDPDVAHMAADKALLDFIDVREVRDAYERITQP